MSRGVHGFLHYFTSLHRIPFPPFHSITQVSLSVGAYRTDEGKPWVLPSILEAEKRVMSKGPLSVKFPSVTHHSHACNTPCNSYCTDKGTPWWVVPSILEAEKRVIAGSAVGVYPGCSTR